MYYRRKILLSLLEAFGGELQKIKLQKLLMLLSKSQPDPSFDFVPYRYGCFSFQANADLHTMLKYEQVAVDDRSWIKVDRRSYLKQLKQGDAKAIQSIKKVYGSKSSEELIKLTYERFPYYAINSVILDKVLPNAEDFGKVEKLKVRSEEKKLFTIGYEGVSIEAYLNKLLRHGIKGLIDVRRNPLSRKYGFSKNQLQNACHGVGIKYFHLPELGIDSSKRQELESQKDYDLLFEDYKVNSIPNTIESQNKIVDLLQELNRVALTCFEADVCQCHRKPLSEAISNLPKFNYALSHI